MKEELKWNPSALFSLVLIILSGFYFPVFTMNSSSGFAALSKTTTVYNLFLNIFSGQSLISSNYTIAIFVVILIYLLIAFFYLLNGFGLIYNEYSNYASILTIVYLILGIISTVLINTATKSTPIFGALIPSFTIGLGTYFITIVGVSYLFLHEKINSIIKI